MSAAARFSASFPAPASVETAVSPSLQLRAGEALGVWRITAPGPVCESGRWYGVEHSLTRQVAAVLVYQHPDEAMPVLLRYAEQAGLQAGLAHALFVAALDSGVTANGLPYLVLPSPDGRLLMPGCAELPLRQRLQLGLQLCEALQSLRGGGLVLRELDPGLLWLGAGQQLRLLNPALADLADQGDGEVPRAPRLAAAVQPFVSPELRVGALPSLASEAFAVGMLVCWLANGRPLRPQDEQHLLQSSAALSGLGGAERVSLEALLHKAVAPTTVARYPSVRELGEDLRAWLAGGSLSALRLTPMPATGAANDAAMPGAMVASGSMFVPAFDGSADAAPSGWWARLRARLGLS